MSDGEIGVLVKIPIPLHTSFKKALLDSSDDKGVVPTIKGVVIDFIENYVEAVNNAKDKHKRDSKEGS